MLSMFEARLKENILSQGMVKPNHTVLIGCSGGADSTALVCALAHLRHALGIQPMVVHYNHRVRSGSTRDEVFVQQLCEKLNLPFIVERRKGKISEQLSEDQMRSLRMKFFLKSAKRLHAQGVCLAHTQNDLAETVLMRLIRGAGLDGLRAIHSKRVMNDVMFIRPLLCFTRAEIEQYLKKLKQPFCTDETNRQTKYLRNKIRLTLLPLLGQMNPSIVNALSNVAVSSGDDYDFLRIEAERRLKENLVSKPGRVKIPTRILLREHTSLRRMMIRSMIERLKPSEGSIGFDHVRLIEMLLTKGLEKQLNLPQGLKALIKNNNLEMCV